MAEPHPWDRLVELARISMDNPVAAAVLRLHYEEYGSCAECGPDSNKGWPCPTVQAIEHTAGRPKPIVDFEALGVSAELEPDAQLDTTEEVTDGPA
jgi:hypothetical protein